MLIQTKIVMPSARPVDQYPLLCLKKVIIARTNASAEIIIGINVHIEKSGAGAG